MPQNTDLGTLEDKEHFIKTSPHWNVFNFDLSVSSIV